MAIRVSKVQLKRAATAGNIPSDLDYGELGLDHLSNPPKLWTRVPATRDPLERINLLDVSSKIIFSSLAPPIEDYLPGQLWFDTSEAILYILYEDQDSRQWIVTTARGPAGPRGEGLRITGSVPSSSDLPDPGEEGDIYLTGDGHGWGWDHTRNLWVDLGPINSGPIGDPGPIGPRGEIGLPSFSFTNQSFEVPQIGHSIEVRADQVAWMSPGFIVAVRDLLFIIREINISNSSITIERISRHTYMGPE